MSEVVEHKTGIQEGIAAFDQFEEANVVVAFQSVICANGKAHGGRASDMVGIGLNLPVKRDHIKLIIRNVLQFALEAFNGRGVSLQASRWPSSFAL